MAIHFFESSNENKTLCNTNSNNHTKNKEEVTCKRCKFSMESMRLLEIKYKNEGKIIAYEIRNKHSK